MYEGNDVDWHLALGLLPHGLPGKLIVFCGPDGSGKSTLVKYAIEVVKDLGHEAREVDLLDDSVRSSWVFREYADRPSVAARKVDMLALGLLCAGSRLQTVRREVLPALADGTWILCDRYVFTIWAEYLAYADLSDNADVLRAALALFPRPDLGLLPFVGAETALRRVKARPEEAEKNLGVQHYQKLIPIYRSVGKCNGFNEFSTDRSSLPESKAFVRACLLTLDGYPYAAA
jgi:dTMP kinase